MAGDFKGRIGRRVALSFVVLLVGVVSVCGCYLGHTLEEMRRGLVEHDERLR